MTDDYLLLAVEKLARGTKTKIIQTSDAGISCIGEVAHEPLLLILRDAIAGGTSPRAGVVASEDKIPLNSGASELFAPIARQINAWYRALPGAVEERYIHDRLNDWYLDYRNRVRRGDVSEADEKHVLRTLEGWVRAIESMFDPPNVIQVTTATKEPLLKPKTRRRFDPDSGESYREPVLDGEGNPVMTPRLDKNREPRFRLVDTRAASCPICGERYALDPKTGDRIYALIIEQRESLGVELDNTTAMCRFCEEVWRGQAGVTRLREQIDQVERDTLNNMRNAG
jgi:hypothetical protein